MEKITLHQALAELKLIDAKIQKQVDKIMPVGYLQKEKVNGFTPKEEFMKDAQSKYDSIMVLFDRKNKLKKALVAINAVTKVTVGTNEMTIADAICYKQQLELKKYFIKTLADRYQDGVGKVNVMNTNAQQQAQAMLLKNTEKSGVKTNDEEIKTIVDNVMKLYSVEFFDPMNIKEKIETMLAEVEVFETNVDFALSTANATTYIEI